MRLAAVLEPDRVAPRRGVSLAATLRDGADAPCDIEILDISASGFLADLPEGQSLAPGARVRVAATAIGRHDAVLVRSDDRRHGFVFTRPLSPDAIAAIGPREPNVSLLFAPVAAEPGRASLSPRVSLLLVTGIAGAMWGALGSVLYLTA